MLENTKYQKLDPFPSSGKGECPTQLGPLEVANLIHCACNLCQPVSFCKYRRTLLEHQTVRAFFSFHFFIKGVGPEDIFVLFSGRITAPRSAHSRNVNTRTEY
jgi:hypothetical protein